MIGERIKERREYLDMSQDELAKKVGYKSRSSINKMELGIQDVPQRKIKEFAKALDCTIGFLLEDDKPENSRTQFPANLFIPNMRKVPMLGKIACGEPIFAEEEYEDMADLPEGIKADFALTAQGNSMTGARIHDGDIVFCRSAERVPNGKIAAVIIEDEATLKRFYYYQDRDLVILKPENPDYEDFIYSGPEIDQIRVIGEAVAFQSRIK